ncbi:alpha/beta hydrolase fold family protein [Burkholderia cenocepacia]|uniref:Alpha/beta hydrolase fold family protein n=1 Tax=Burkholderia cenocepacia TaxID=95486 RepID=A0AAN0VRR6_9BURK|nr:alpha/beta hydrolase fold family protein [Burkholderia cenocepacia]
MKSMKLIGRGPRKVLLFPGLLGTRDGFDDMLGYADLETFQYVVVEYRGYGQARGAVGLLTLREIVIDAVRLVDYLGWSRFAVAGHSLGALVAQMLAIALPNRVNAIVSIAGLSAKGASPDTEKVAFMQTMADSREAREALVRTGTACRYTDAVARKIVRATWDDIDGRALASYALDASRTDVHADVQALDMPILVLVGEHDPNCTEVAARDTTLRWYRRSTLEILHGAGHYPMFETPTATVSAIESFLKSMAPDAAGRTSEQSVAQA